MRCYAYLHGFASGPRSRKGLAFQAAFATHGQPLALPDLNQPTFGTLTLTAALEAIDRLVAAGPAEAGWSFIGSSLGGWLAARWAELHPERTDRLVLLCPGFDMVGRWPALLGPTALARWRAHGSLPFKDGAGQQVPLHWGFIEDALTHPRTPVAPCPTLILHGTRDSVVPLASSEAYAAAHANMRLIRLDDDHQLTSSIGRIADESLAFLAPPAHP